MDGNSEVIVVDDDIELASNMKDILEAEGYCVTVAHDGKTALEQGARNKFLLAIIDLRLPDIPGVKLVEELARLCPVTEFIIVTGYATLDTAIKAVGQERIIAYETKPFDIERFLALVRHVTERKKAEEALSKRYKELSCLYSIDMIRSRTELNEQEICQEVVNILPQAWLYPESTGARLTLSSMEFETNNYRDTEWSQSSDIRMHGSKVGEVKIVYLEEKPKLDEGPFMKEERQLINSVAEQLARIIEGKQAEEEIANLAKFPSESPNPVLRVANNGTILYANPVSSPLLDLWKCGVGQHLPEDLYKCVLEVQDAKTSKNTEVKCDDHEFSLTLAPVVAAGYVNIYAYDITERKKAEENTRRAAQQWRTTFDSIHDFLSIHDRDFRIVRVNRSLSNLFKMEPKEVLGKHCYELFHGSSGPCSDCPYIRTMETKMPATLELFHDGWGIYIEITTSPVFNEMGEVIDCVHIVRDITERKKAEQARERLNQKLQVKVSELETFSYGIAHDLRSPLISVEGLIRFLREDMLKHDDDDATRVQEDIRLLESAVRKMRDFLNGTLVYSRAGQLVKRIKDVSFGKIVNEVLKGLNVEISLVGATVSVADEFPGVYADESRITQVLTNLIQNSIKYRDETVPLKIEIGYRLSEGEVVFFVCDNGLGIDESDVGKVFDLFYRGTAEGEGSGIGLSIVKKIIEAHGGRIWVEQGQSGKGTTMCFTLPQQNGTNEENNNGKD